MPESVYGRREEMMVLVVGQTSKDRTELTRYTCQESQSETMTDVGRAHDKSVAVIGIANSAATKTDRQAGGQANERTSEKRRMNAK